MAVQMRTRAGLANPNAKNRSETPMTPVPAAVALPAPASSACAGRGGLLLAVCLDQALDEFVDGAGLGQVTPVQQVAQLGLGLALVTLAGLLVSLPGLVTFGLTGLASLPSSCRRPGRTASSWRPAGRWTGPASLSSPAGGPGPRAGQLSCAQRSS
jgi:hypothetical protein